MLGVVAMALRVPPSLVMTGTTFFGDAFRRPDRSAQAIHGLRRPSIRESGQSRVGWISVAAFVIALLDLSVFTAFGDAVRRPGRSAQAIHGLRRPSIRKSGQSR